MEMISNLLGLDNIKQILKKNYDYLSQKTDDALIDFLANKIVDSFVPYEESLLIYPIATAQKMFNSYLNQFAPQLLMRCITESIKFKKPFINDDGYLGGYSMDTSSGVGYKGFDTQNQETTFEQNKSLTVFRGNQTLNYITYLEVEFNIWAREFKDFVIIRLARMVY